VATTWQRADPQALDRVLRVRERLAYLAVTNDPDAALHPTLGRSVCSSKAKVTVACFCLRITGPKIALLTVADACTARAPF
jgi:hypothetical protein